MDVVARAQRRHDPWDAAAIAAGFPALSATWGMEPRGVRSTTSWKRSRINPWWMTRSEAEAARAETRRDQALGAAPALWVLVVLIALTLPVLTSPPP